MEELGKNMEGSGLSYTSGEHVKWYNCFEKQLSTQKGHVIHHLIPRYLPKRKENLKAEDTIS